jgi:hypothetical protein
MRYSDSDEKRDYLYFTAKEKMFAMFDNRTLRFKPYTEKIHAGRLLARFKGMKRIGQNNELGCPASFQFSPMISSSLRWRTTSKGSACDICKNFLGLRFPSQCPCREHGSCENAVKLTWIQLEERGYI